MHISLSYNALQSVLEAVMSSEWMTTEEIANILRVKESTVREWIRQKRLKAAKIGRDYRISREDYQKFIAESYSDDADKEK